MNGVLSSSQLSLNVLISLFEKIGFRSLIGIDNSFTTKRNSFADRLIGLNSDYFKALFGESVKLFSKHFPAHQINGYHIHMFDSTMVSCSAKLFFGTVRPLDLYCQIFIEKLLLLLSFLFVTFSFVEMWIS